jgi:hypothetical protein
MARGHGLVLAMLLVVVIAGCHGGSDSPSGPPTASPSSLMPADVVPWAGLPATHPTLPTVRIPPRPDPAVAAAARPCRPGQLRARAGFGAAAGTTYEIVRVSLARGSRCRLSGSPRVMFLDPGSVPVDVIPDRAIWGWERGPALVTAGDNPVDLRLSWQDDCLEAVRSRLSITLASGTRPLVVRGFRPEATCRDTRRLRRIGASVFPFYRERTRPAHHRSAYAGLEATGQLNLSTSRPGRTIGYAVTLTAPRDLPLDPCPDYVVHEAHSGPQESMVRGLNCDAVSYRDTSGTPYLPAGVPVTFAMRLVAPDSGSRTFVWSLVLPDTVRLAGQVVVR